MSLRDTAAMTGVGETRYQRGATRPSTALQLEAALAAIADAGLRPRDIDGIIPIGITGAPAEELATNLGVEELRFSALTPMGGASSIAAIQCAAAAIQAGLCNHVLIAAGRNVSSGAKAGTRIHQMPQFHLITEFELPLGAIAPAQLYAPMARRHMELYGTTSAQLGEIATTNWMYPARDVALPTGFADLPRPDRTLFLPPDQVAAQRDAAIAEWQAALSR